LEDNLTEVEERELYSVMLHLTPEAQALEEQQKYREALEVTARLRPVIDAFFDKVMVMTPDDKLRRNRLALIARVLENFSRVGDFSEIVPG
jgi:glycyl-tRNA synthetase beta chain